MKVGILFLFLFSFSSLSFIFSADAKFLSDEDLEKARPALQQNGMTESQFRDVIAKIQNAYAPIVSKLGGKLAISGDWKSEKLNASANQSFGSWAVQISGALARRPELSLDGFALIICHELGHHLGGFALANPTFPPVPIPGIPSAQVWAAVEGQADYFSTQVCSRKLWASDAVINADFRSRVHPVAKDACDSQWSAPTDQDLCYRGTVAAQSIGATMAGIKQQPVPLFETPDTKAVAKTFEGHPAIQCRLDTLFAGSICSANFDDNMIPGKAVSQGPASPEAERQAALVSCTTLSGAQQGLRPACWFKARM